MLVPVTTVSPTGRLSKHLFSCSVSLLAAAGFEQDAELESLGLARGGKNKEFWTLEAELKPRTRGNFWSLRWTEDQEALKGVWQQVHVAVNCPLDHKLADCVGTLLTSEKERMNASRQRDPCSTGKFPEDGRGQRSS